MAKNPADFLIILDGLVRLSTVSEALTKCVVGQNRAGADFHFSISQKILKRLLFCCCHCKQANICFKGIIRRFGHCADLHS